MLFKDGEREKKRKNPILTNFPQKIAERRNKTFRLNHEAHDRQARFQMRRYLIPSPARKGASPAHAGRGQDLPSPAVTREKVAEGRMRGADSPRNCRFPSL